MVVIVAAVGNDAVNAVAYPAAYPGVLSVGAVDANGQHLYFSNRGPAVDLVAPGYGVEAAWLDDQTVLFSGTSAATPIVSGALAALLSTDRALPVWSKPAGQSVTLLERWSREEYGRMIAPRLVEVMRSWSSPISVPSVGW